MKKVLLFVYNIAALAALGWFCYTAYPIFPYVNDQVMLLPTGVFLVFLFLAFKASKERDKELAQEAS
jgi:hypothetical protein